MTDRLEVATELEALEKRLSVLAAISPGGAVFWAIFNRRRKAIENHAERADIEFVRVRVKGMLAAQRLTPGCHDRSAFV